MRFAAFLLSAALAAAPARAGWTFQGVCYDANWEERATAWYGSPLAEKQLQRLKGIGVNSLSITEFAHQRDVKKPEITYRERVDDGLLADIRKAQALGMKIVIKPHIWSNQFWDGSGHWHGTIEMRNAGDWAAWFANYEKMIVHHARHAREVKADVFVIGLEYVKATNGRDAEWRKVIESVRRVYPGKITYAAHSFEEAEQIGFWDKLDFVGINAYFSLTSKENPGLTELRAAWKKHAGRLEALSRKAGKPVLITETGYSAVVGAASRPFEWHRASAPVSEREQALCYEAMLAELDNRPWLAGLFLWKFKVSVTPREESREPSEWYFAFQDKMAEKVVAQFFGRKP